MFFTFPECKKLTNITLKLWNKGFWQPILCYWPLYIPTEKIRKPEIFWFFQGAQKGTSGIKWAREREREREKVFFSWDPGYLHLAGSLSSISVSGFKELAYSWRRHPRFNMLCIIYIFGISLLWLSTQFCYIKSRMMLMVLIKS